MHDRRPGKGMGLVHHSDRGSQYPSIRYSERLDEAGIEPSVGSVGDSYDNALGSRLIDPHSQNRTVAARATAERKVLAHLS